MKQNIKPCLEAHLPGKVKPGNVVSADAWFDVAEAHLQSARAVIDGDPAGSFLLSWESMHKTA